LLRLRLRLRHYEGCAIFLRSGKMAQNYGYYVLEFSKNPQKLTITQ
jgi:hypothetical protein